MDRTRRVHSWDKTVISKFSLLKKFCLFYFQLTCRHVSSLCMCVMCEGVSSPGVGIKDGCELPCGFWEPKPNPLQEQQVFLTVEPAIQ